jgi:uncharacterized membrane protein YdjX (TVP38/TMEM64 family)
VIADFVVRHRWVAYLASIAAGFAVGVVVVLVLLPGAWWSCAIGAVCTLVGQSFGSHVHLWACRRSIAEVVAEVDRLEALASTSRREGHERST